jgi:sulfur-oxidizing protein SoxX
MEGDNLAAIKWPADNKWLGDYKKGEAVAQNGRGLTSTDKADGVNGGNCYNCHQISKQEVAHGTIGPSLYNYGKIKGNSDETLRYTWGKIYNAKASNACSNMPRAGHMGIITEEQIRDLMALLLDPQSPVNQ